MLRRKHDVHSASSEVQRGELKFGRISKPSGKFIDTLFIRKGYDPKGRPVGLYIRIHSLFIQFMWDKVL